MSGAEDTGAPPAAGNPRKSPGTPVITSVYMKSLIEPVAQSQTGLR